MITRALESIAFAESWGRQMRFICGPRQSGKTTLAKSQLRAQKCETLYYLWDQRTIRQRYKEDELFFTADFPLGQALPWVCMDEIHKYPQWKNILKSVFDSVGDRCRFIVTGSAKLSLIRRAGDSLAGRYFTFHLLPIMLGEFSGYASRLINCPPTALDFLHTQANTTPADPERQEALFHFGGFPEPLLSANAAFHRKWSADYIETVIREDIGTLTKIVDREHLHDLYHLLPGMVGSPLSVASLAGHIQVSPVTVKNHLRRLDDFFLTFSIRPYTHNIKRSLLKAPKLYLYDWTRIDDPAARFENYVACELLGRTKLWSDNTGKAYELFYVRNKQKQETDFLVTKEGIPWLLVEAKQSDRPVESHHIVTREALGNVPIVQVCAQPDICSIQRESVYRMSAGRFFA